MKEKLTLYKINRVHTHIMEVDMKTQNKNKYRCIVAALLVAMMVFLLVSCAQTSVPTEENATSSSAESSASVASSSSASPEKDKTLHILLAQNLKTDYSTGKQFLAYDSLGQKIKIAVQKYNEKKLGHIVIDTVQMPRDNTINGGESNSGSYGDSIYDYLYMNYVDSEKLGTAPDIIIFSPYGGMEMSFSFQNSTNTELYKYIKNNYLTDLTTYMEEDETYLRSDYVEGVMDGGIIGGKQLFIPLMYQVPMYAGIYERSAESGAPTPDSFESFSEFWQQVTNASKYANAQGISLIASEPWPTSMRNYGACYQLYTNENVLDFNSGVINRENEAFRIMLRSSFASEDLFRKTEGRGSDYSDDRWDMRYVYEGKSCMGLSYENGKAKPYLSMSIGRYRSATSVNDDEKPYVRAIPAYDDVSKSTAQITLAMSVSESCRNKQEAYNFIKYCLDSTELYDSLNNALGSFWFSYAINKSQIKAYIDEAAREVGGHITDGTSIDDTVAQLYSDVTNISYAAPYYQPLNVIFWKRFKETYNNNPDRSDPDALIDEMCDAIDQDLQTFFAS